MELYRANSQMEGLDSRTALRPVARYIGGYGTQRTNLVRQQWFVCRRLQETLRAVKTYKAAVASADRGIIATRVGRGL